MSYVEYCNKINTMNSTMLYNKISSLPPSMIKEVDNFIEFLKNKKIEHKFEKERKFGCGKGLMVMNDDFDSPLEDFEEYMQ